MSENLKFEYTFKLEDGNHHYNVEIDESNLGLVVSKDLPDELLSYCKLEDNQCENCPLKAEEYPHCPAAMAIMGIVESFRNKRSYEKCSVEVKTKNRNYEKYCDVQKGLQSILGLKLAVSACPHMKFLRPMARFHLPFSSSEETLVRVLAFHLLGDFANEAEHGANLDKLTDNYNALNLVNQGLLKRVEALENEDAGRNAIVVLDTFLQMFNTQLEIEFEPVLELFKFKEEA